MTQHLVTRAFAATGVAVIASLALALPANAMPLPDPGPDTAGPPQWPTRRLPPTAASRSSRPESASWPAWGSVQPPCRPGQPDDRRRSPVSRDLRDHRHSHGSAMAVPVA